MTRPSDLSRATARTMMWILALVLLALPLGAAAQHTGGSFGGGHWGGGGYHGGGGSHAPSARYRGGHSGGAHGRGGSISLDPELHRGLLLVVAMSASTFWGAGLGLWAGASLDGLCRRALRQRQRRRRARAVARRSEEAR